MKLEKQILDLLDRKKNVLLMGAPGTGKSRMLNEIASLFEGDNHPNPHPEYDPHAPVPIPQTAGDNDISFLSGKQRRVFRTVLHQNSKYRDFFTGFVPSPGTENGFTINRGILYEANEFAKGNNCASLLIIDEINRGPAVEVFGGSIVAIESDKRLSEDGSKNKQTQFFDILDPNTSRFSEYAFSPRLYILAAMNQADVSVAPLDVAFLRRWVSVKLQPDYDVLAKHFDFNMNDQTPQQPESAKDVYLVVTKALKEVNRLITIGKGADYQLGHGILLTENKATDVANALKHAKEIWQTIYTHIEELFFGDALALSYILNANIGNSPYKKIEETFAGENKIILENDDITEANIFNLYLSILEHV